MANDLMPFKLNRDKLIEKYAGLVYKDDAYETTLVYNRIMDDHLKTMALSERPFNKDSLEYFKSNKDTAINLRQVTVYGRLNAHGMEIDTLLKVLTDEAYLGYDCVAVLNRLITFFGFMMGIDVFDYYLNFFKDRFPQDERLAVAKRPIEAKISKGLHFVDENQTFNIVLSKMATGDYNGAIGEIDSKAKLSEKDFRVKNLEVAMLLSMGAEKSATQILEELEKSGCDDAEFYANLYQLSKLNNIYVDKAIKLLEVDSKLFSSHDLLVILASLYNIKKEHQKVVETLNHIKGIKKDSREVLKLLAESFYALKEKDKLAHILKRMVTLYPNDIWARFYLLNENFDLGANTNSFQPEACEQLKKYLIEKTKSKDAFDKMDREDAHFLFKSLEEIRESVLAKNIIRKIYKSKHRSLLFDAMISVHSDNVTLQLLLQVLLEEIHESSFYILQNCELKKHKINYPKQFMISHEDTDKYQFLKTCYSQTYALVFSLGFDTAEVGKKLESALEWLFSQDLLNDELLFRDECVVYLLSNVLFFESEYVDITFKKLKKADKQRLLDVAKNLINKEKNDGFGRV